MPPPPPTRKDGTASDAFQCASCDKVFASKKQLTVHQYLQHAAKLECKDCGKSFKTDDLLKKHMLSHEEGVSGGGSGKNSRVCTVCNEVFPLMRDLVEHHHQMHVQQKAFRCSVCNKQFSWRANLEKHMSMHQTTHHTCVKCGRGFWDADSLHEHLRSFHQDREITGNKPYACEVCGRAFEFDFTYKAHLTSHEGYVPPATAPSNKKTAPVRSKSQRQHTPRVPNRITASDGRHEIVVEFLPASSTATTVTTPAKAAAAAASSGSSASPAKSLPRKRKYEKYTPAVGNLVMTDELPFACDVCGQRFRWEISLKIHAQQHDDDELELGVRGLRKERRGANTASRTEQSSRQTQSPQKQQQQQAAVGRDSRIVARRASDDEEDFDDDDDEDVEEISPPAPISGASNNGETTAAAAAVSASPVEAPALRKSAHRSEPVIGTVTEMAASKVLGEVPAPATVIIFPSQSPAADSLAAVEPSFASDTVEQRSVVITVSPQPLNEVAQPSLAPVVQAHLQWQRVLGQTRRALVCKLCPYVASTPALLRRHALGHLASYFMHQCTHCGEGFPVQRELILHALLHEAEPSAPLPHLRCTECGRKFSGKAALRRHRMRHVRKFKVATCAQCCRKFVSERLLLAHEGVHSSANAATRWQCTSCQRQLDSEAAFEQHKSVGCISDAFL